MMTPIGSEFSAVRICASDRCRFSVPTEDTVWFCRTDRRARQDTIGYFFFPDLTRKMASSQENVPRTKYAMAMISPT